MRLCSLYERSSFPNLWKFVAFVAKNLFCRIAEGEELNFHEKIK
jgi:hypothetical protein